MQDKPVQQQRLARDLASLVSVLNDDVVLPFLEAFWKTMAREWGGIDALRRDKYLFLIRQYLNASFRYLARNNWTNEAAIKRYSEILQEMPLNVMDPKIPNGIRYHMLDIYVDELEKVGGEEWDENVLERLLEPVRKLASESRVKSLRNAAKECLEDDRVRKWRGDEIDEGGDADMKDGEDEEWGGIED